MTAASRLVLGTAQFGSDYGITNTAGRVNDDELARILETAQALGITRLDTALDYGDAQARLAPWVDAFRITTKVKAAAGIGSSVGSCLEQLAVTTLDGLLVHDWASLDAETRAAAADDLTTLRQDGIADAVGVSVYDESEIVDALALMPILDAVQAPVSVLDQRLASSSAVDQLRARGGELQARSVLLQGLLAAPDPTHPDVIAFQGACASLGVSPVAGAIGFVATLPWVDTLVVGLTTADELTQIATALSSLPDALAFTPLASSDLALIDPRRWS